MARTVISNARSLRAHVYRVALASAALAAVSCSAETGDSSVSFHEGAQLGRWEEESASAAPETAAPTASAAQATAPKLSAVTSAMAPPAAAPASAPAMPPAAAAVPSGAPPTANSTTPVGASMAATPAMGATSTTPATTVTEGPPTNAIARLSYKVTTETYGGKYQPRNVGAVWVEDGSGKLVKSLEVWTRTRTRYLTRYNQARAGARIDVLTTGTLATHRAHQAMWDLKDINGTTVKPGVYKLWLEMTEDDGAGETFSVDVDTTQPAEALAPADAPGFTQLKVDLQ